MNCQEINGQLGTLLDQAVDLRLAMVLEQHLAYCADCQVELERLRALKTVLQCVEPPVPSANLDARVLAAFQQQHQPPIHVTSSASSWRTWFFGAVNIPKPALALLGMMLVGILVLAYKVGELRGMRLPTVEPPVLAHNQTAPPVESLRVVYVKTPGGCSRTNSQSAAMLAQSRIAKAVSAEPVALQFETQASASAAGIDYTTTTALESFEPVKDPSVRIIKGGNQ